MDKWTVLLARAAGDDPSAREFEEQLLKELRAAGLLGREAFVTGDLYHLPPNDPACTELRKVEGPLLVLSWRYPRAVFWILNVAGVAGVRVDLASDAGEGRAIHCVDLRSKCCPGRIVEQVAAILPAADGVAEVRHFEPASEKRWYPVIDYSRCTGCLQCPEFCLFGVYEVENGLPFARHPGNCKPGCPACSRVCPAHAIMFPDYAKGGPIAGADTGEIKPFRIQDIDPSFLPAECAEAIKKRFPATQCACGCMDQQLDAALEQLDTDE